jgi:hypothetical protein
MLFFLTLLLFCCFYNSFSTKEGKEFVLRACATKDRVPSSSLLVTMTPKNTFFYRLSILTEDTTRLTGQQNINNITGEISYGTSSTMVKKLARLNSEHNIYSGLIVGTGDASFFNKVMPIGGLFQKLWAFMTLKKEESKCHIFFLPNEMEVFAKKIFDYFSEYKLFFNPLIPIIPMFFIGLKNNTDGDFLDALKTAEEIRTAYSVKENEYDRLLDKVTVEINFHFYTDFINYLINKYNTFDDFYNPEIGQGVNFKLVMYEYVDILLNDLDFKENNKEKLNFVSITFKNFVQKMLDANCDKAFSILFGCFQLCWKINEFYSKHIPDKDIKIIKEIEAENNKRNKLVDFVKKSIKENIPQEDFIGILSNNTLLPFIFDLFGLELLIFPDVNEFKKEYQNWDIVFI